MLTRSIHDPCDSSSDLSRRIHHVRLSAFDHYQGHPEALLVPVSLAVVAHHPIGCLANHSVGHFPVVVRCQSPPSGAHRDDHDPASALVDLDLVDAANLLVLSLASPFGVAAVSCHLVCPEADVELLACLDLAICAILSCDDRHCRADLGVPLLLVLRTGQPVKDGQLQVSELHRDGRRHQGRLEALDLVPEVIVVGRCVHHAHELTFPGPAGLVDLRFAVECC